MKILVILGTRPEVIKMAPVIKALRTAGLDTVVCASGQHREMLLQALEVFQILPEYSLDVMSPRQTLNTLSARLLVALDQTLAEVEPDWVLVQGDTTTAFCGGLAAFNRGIRIGHVEAGLRTGDLSSPFPEEANRSLLARISTLHFAPTHAAKLALMSEGLKSSDIRVTGNTVVDSLKMAQEIISNINPSHELQFVLNQAKNKPLVLVTCHRRENFGGPLEAICALLKRLSERYTNIHWVFPVHLNPNVLEPVNRILVGVENISLISPVDYLTNLSLISRAILIVSDSGGIQEEAPSFGVPVVVMRNHTERKEGIEAGFSVLAGQCANNIENAIINWLDNPQSLTKLKKLPNPYGDGKASERIVATLINKPIDEFNG